MKKTIFVVIGTRPEAIKMAPVILKLKNHSPHKVFVVATGQHRELLDSALDEFNITPDDNLGVMQHGQGLASLTAAILVGMEKLIAQKRPDLVLVHGDTTSSYATALACFYAQIPVGHVEAGLRSHQLDSPFPEEFNRRSITQFSALHFAVDEDGLENLLNDGVDQQAIRLTGNTVVDSLAHMKSTPARQTQTQAKITTQTDSPHKMKKLLITLHRREKGDESFKNILRAVRKFCQAHPEIEAVYPLHANPRVRSLAFSQLGSLANMNLLEPLPYSKFLKELNSASVVLTDSGGIQEEAYYLGKPTLIVRDTTERRHGLDRGSTVLVSDDQKKIYHTLEQFFQQPSPFRSLCPKLQPSVEIVKHIHHSLHSA